jgi:hypothetical protein
MHTATSRVEESAQVLPCKLKFFCGTTVWIFPRHLEFLGTALDQKFDANPCQHQDLKLKENVKRLKQLVLEKVAYVDMSFRP